MYRIIVECNFQSDFGGRSLLEEITYRFLILMFLIIMGMMDSSSITDINTSFTGTKVHIIEINTALYGSSILQVFNIVATNAAVNAVK